MRENKKIPKDEPDQSRVPLLPQDSGRNRQRSKRVSEYPSGSERCNVDIFGESWITKGGDKKREIEDETMRERVEKVVTAFWSLRHNDDRRDSSAVDRTPDGRRDSASEDGTASVG